MFRHAPRPHAKTISCKSRTLVPFWAQVFLTSTFCCQSILGLMGYNKRNRWGSRRKVAAKAWRVHPPGYGGHWSFALRARSPTSSPSLPLEPQSGTSPTGGEVRPLRGHPCKGMRERSPKIWRASFGQKLSNVGGHCPLLLGVGGVGLTPLQAV